MPAPLQAVVLAAGIGNRIASASNGLPKSYLPLAGETLLSRNLRLLRSIGVSNIIIVTGHQHDRFAADFSAPDTQLVFNPFFQSSNVLVSFWCALPHLSSDFIYLHADTVFDPAILANLAAAPPATALLAADRKPCAEEEMKYTLKPDGTVALLNKTMPPAQSRGEFLGLARFSAAALPILRSGVHRVLARGEFHSFFEAALQEMIDLGDLQPAIMDTGTLPWREIDFPEDYQAARALFPDPS